MSYAELIARALKGRSVNQAAKDWHLPQPTLFRYIRGERLPDYATAAHIKKDAGATADEVLNALADEEIKRKKRSTMEKISANFKALVSHLNPRGSLLLAR